MIEKKFINGRTYTSVSNLQEWDKNPRYIEESDFLRLKKQIAKLGQYKPLLVTEHGIVIGGNMRLRAMKWLNQNVLEYTDENGELVQIDRKGQYEDIAITEIGFAWEELPVGEEGAPKRVRAVLDGKLQEKWFESTDQLMVEYALSDNDAAGHYEAQALAELLTPHKHEIPLPDYKLELGFPVSAKSFLDDYQPSNKPQGNLPDYPEDNDEEGDDSDSDTPNGLENQRKQNYQVFVAKFTPTQWTEEGMNERINTVREMLNRENDTDVLVRMIEVVEGLIETNIQNPNMTVHDFFAPFLSTVSADLTEREEAAQDTVENSTEPTA